jgi:hypothetical protein
VGLRHRAAVIAALMVGVAALGAWLRFGVEGGASSVGGWLLGLAIAPNLALLAVGRVIASRALSRAEALVARLPFDATSYLEALRSPPLVVPRGCVEVIEVTVELAFVDAPPPLASLETLLPLASDSLRLHDLGDGAVTLTMSGFDPWPSLRRLLGEVLGPLAKAHPIARLTMRLERRLSQAESD